MSDKPAYTETAAMIVNLAQRQGAGRPVVLPTERLIALKFDTKRFGSPLEDIRLVGLELHTGGIKVQDVPGGISVEYVPGKKPAKFQETIGHGLADRRRMLGLTRVQVAAWAQTSVAKISDLEDGRVPIIGVVGAGNQEVAGYSDVLRTLEARAQTDPKRFSPGALRGEMNALVANARSVGPEGNGLAWQHWPVARPDQQTVQVVEWRYGDRDGPFIGKSHIEPLERLLESERYGRSMTDVWWRPATAEDLP